MNLTVYPTRLGSLFDGFFDTKPFWFKNTNEWFDNIPEDLIEYEDKYEVSIELPGVKKEDIKIDFESNKLKINAVKKCNYSDTKANKINVLRDYGEINKSYYISNAIDKDKIEAEYVDGILTITIPKNKENIMKKITVK
jgi:HSP20 family protein